jgi:cytochrome P450
LFEIIRDTFKEPGFNRNDFLFTAQEDIAKMYHDMTVRFLTGPRLGECRAFIKNACKETLESWATQGKEGKSVNITQETRNFASKVITHLAFGETQQNKGIGEAINFINLHISKKTFGKATKADEVEYEKKLKLLKELINEILDSSAELPMFKGLDPQLNRAQKQALMFIYLFGGQETVASLLNYLLLTLGQDKDLQAKLKTEVNQKKNNEDLTLLDSIRQLFVKGIRDFTPAYGITSQAKEDICLKFTVDGRKYKYIFFKGEKISAMTINHADAQPKQPDDYSAWKPFAEGPRRCPGEKLAKIEILEFIVQALKGYVIDVPSDYKAVKRGAITLQLVDDVLAKVVKG